MKNLIKFLLVFTSVSLLLSCDDAYDVNYDPTVKISFDGVEDGIAVLDKGVDKYTAKIRVKATHGISYFEIYEADPMTGNKGTLIEGTSISIEPAVSEYTYEFSFSVVTENTCIRVSATDVEGITSERNLVVKITPSVLFSENIIMETADDYYGSYYATWLDGRVYLKSNLGDYIDEVDISMGMVEVDDVLTPSLISPAKRGEYDLPAVSGLQDTKFALTNLTIAEYQAIPRVNDSMISSLTDPTLSSILLENGKVYLFKTADGKKGLIAITGTSNRTGTIQNAAGEWVKEYPYTRVNMTTKTMAK